jgi:hydrogenase maturation protein HypF
MQRLGIWVEGLVQGVGFRPFVYTLAHAYGLNGFVRNTPEGVYMEIEGDDKKIDTFIENFHAKLPPLARIDVFKSNPLELKADKEFIIVHSDNAGSKHSAILPDMAVCEDCLSEMRNPENRRYEYPFTNCTNCGPRYSIIRTVPYDRPNTSMDVFKMCPQCQAEYDNPLDRRYHAQPISCPNCGPRLKLIRISDGVVVEKDKKAISQLAKEIKDGAIVAMKGLGGFHLVCDALSPKAIQVLRERKNRPTKPFAVLCKNLEMAREYALMDEAEVKMLTSITKPIVLVSKKPNTLMPQEIAPHTDRLGLFLPYTPLHVCLFEFLNNPLVATSANLSGEPIIHKGEMLGEKLAHVVDFVLDFDREIINANDDSVVQVVDNKPLYLRLSRGLSPLTFPVETKSRKTVLAVGAQQKNALALLHEGRIIQSPYIGDMHTLEGFEFFTRTLEGLKSFYDIEPKKIVCDMHPNYQTSLWAKEQGLPTVSVQHHHAHICATMLEYGLRGPVLGVAWDGTGYGSDGTIWGGEFLLCKDGEFERIGNFEPFKLIGADVSIKDIWRIAYSMLRDNMGDSVNKLPQFEPYTNKLSLVSQAYEKSINTSLCSSIGRLFDAVAFLATGLGKVSYDGESGLLIERLYDPTCKEEYLFEIKGKNILYKDVLVQMIDDEPRDIVTKFINGLVKCIIDYSKIYNLPIVVGGGVFQNKTLLKRLQMDCLTNSIPLYFPQKIPPNDGGIAFGQLAKYILSQ